MSKKSKNEAVLVLDRSGSMSAIRSDMEGSINDLFEGWKADKDIGDIGITLIMFNDEYEVVYVCKPLTEVEAIVIHPYGTTALLKALTLGISETEERISKLPEDEQPERVQFIVVTDGLENSSGVEYSRDKVMDLIAVHEKENGWDFTYLGANQDAIQAGGDIGVRSGKSMSYAATGEGIKAMTGKLARYSKSYFTTGKAEYTREEQSQT